MAALALATCHMRPFHTERKRYSALPNTSVLVHPVSRDVHTWVRKQNIQGHACPQVTQPWEQCFIRPISSTTAPCSGGCLCLMFVKPGARTKAGHTCLSRPPTILLTPPLPATNRHAAHTHRMKHRAHATTSHPRAQETHSKHNSLTDMTDWPKQTPRSTAKRRATLQARPRVLPGSFQH